MTLRARRRREEAVRRLVADVQAPLAASDPTAAAASNNKENEFGAAAATGAASGGGVFVGPSYVVAGGAGGAGGGAGIGDAETHEWLVASTVAAALERGLDRDLHAELVQESKDNASRIGQICHDHADVFLSSVAKVAALGDPCADLADGLTEAGSELALKTAGPMRAAALRWEMACRSYSRAKTLDVLVQACQEIAVFLERARKQAGLGRPRSALDAAEQARKALATPVDALFSRAGVDPGLFKVATQQQHQLLDGSWSSSSGGAGTAGPSSSSMLSLEQTPFGRRALVVLPKIENEVLMNARRGLNRWFLSLRSGGDQARLGRAVLRHASWSVSTGTGQLGLGGHLPPSYVWRAKTADNLISRLPQNAKVARAVRLGYWFDREAIKEAERLAQFSKLGMERRAEAIASAFGWYRCWDDASALGVDPTEFAFDGDGSVRTGLSGSRHGSRHGGGLSGSRHGLRGSRHGRKTLGFRATTSSRSQAFQDITSTLGTSASVKASNQGSKWAELLIPAILLETANLYVQSLFLGMNVVVMNYPPSHNRYCWMISSFYNAERRTTRSLWPCPNRSTRSAARSSPSPSWGAPTSSFRTTRATGLGRSRSVAAGTGKRAVAIPARPRSGAPSRR